MSYFDIDSLLSTPSKLTLKKPLIGFTIILTVYTYNLTADRYHDS